jgi:hypothetical protein
MVILGNPAIRRTRALGVMVIAGLLLKRRVTQQRVGAIQLRDHRDPAQPLDPGLSERSGRHYETSLLPVLARTPVALQDEAAQRVLLAELTEAAGGWRMLTDVRFKLLALVPPISALALTGIVSSAGPLQGAGRWTRVGAACVGFLVVLALFVYDRRNNALYNDLISRARRAEYELGVDTGVFRGRKEPRNPWISHGWAQWTVYLVVLGAWLAVGLAAAFGLVPSAATGGAVVSTGG